jgi:hypothetical protein
VLGSTCVDLSPPRFSFILEFNSLVRRPGI